MVDLHGLRVEEALEYAKLAFEAAALQEDEDDKEVRFIVGTSSLRPPRRVLMVNCRRIQARDYMRRMVLGPRAKIRPALEELCEEYVRGLILLTFIISVFSPGPSYLRYGFVYYLHPKNAGVLVVHCVVLY